MPAIRINRTAPFPARVSGSGAVTVTKTNGVWTVGLDYTAVGAISPIPAQYTGTYLLAYNTTTSVWQKVSIADIAALQLLSVSPSAGIGYGTGAGGAVVQATSKATGVTLNKVTGQITLNAAALAAAAVVSFTLTNSSIALGDILVMNHISGGTAGVYLLNAQCAAGSASINVRNTSAGSLSEAIVIDFAVIKAVTA